MLVSPANFYPFAHQGGDFYSAETSSPGVYNLQFTGDGTIVFSGGPDRDLDRQGLNFNDVFLFRGTGPGSFGVATRQPSAPLSSTSMRGTIGVPTDGGDPVFEGLQSGITRGSISIDEVVPEGTNRMYTGCGVAPLFGSSGSSMLAFGFDEAGISNAMTYPDVHAVECLVDLDLIPNGTGLAIQKRVKARPLGSDLPFDLLLDGVTSIEELPPVVQGGFGVFDMGDGEMFIDDVFITNLSDPATVPVSQLIDDAFDSEIEAFVKLS